MSRDAWQQVIVDQERMYVLLVDEKGQRFLEVSCGEIAMQDKLLLLTQEDLRGFELQGKSFLDILALKVCRETGFLEKRNAAACQATGELTP